MIILSAVIIVLFFALSLISAIALKGRSGLGIRSASAVAQTGVFMSIVLLIMQMAEASIIYDNEKLDGKYIRDGIDLYFLSKMTALIFGVMLIIAIAIFVMRLIEKRVKPVISFFILAGVIVVGGVASIIALNNSGIYNEYLVMLTPVLPIATGCLIVQLVNTLLVGDKLWNRIIMSAVNLVGLVGVITVDVITIILTKTAIEGMEVNNLGYIVLTLVLLSFSAPAIIIAVSTLRNCFLKRRK